MGQSCAVSKGIDDIYSLPGTGGRLLCNAGSIEPCDLDFFLAEVRFNISLTSDVADGFARRCVFQSPSLWYKVVDRIAY